MKRLTTLLIVLVALTFIASVAFAAFPEDAEWKLPAKYRLIYQIDVSSLTEGNAYVEFNIPSYIYDHIVQRFQNGEMCGLIENDRIPDEVYPVLFYASTYDTAQKYIPYPNYSINDYYEYTTACYDDNNQPLTLKLPKTIMVHISQFDGDQNFQNYQHYIFLYEPFLFLDTGDPGYATQYWSARGWLGDPLLNGTDYGDIPIVYHYNIGNTTKITDLPLTVGSRSQVFLYYSMSDQFQCVYLLFGLSNGETVSLRLGGCSYDLFSNADYKVNYSNISKFTDVKRLVSERLSIPYDSIDKVLKIGYFVGGTAWIDDVYLIVS